MEILGKVHLLLKNVNQKWPLIFCVILVVSCKAKTDADAIKEIVALHKSFQVEVTHGQSSKVDVMHGIYTVFFAEKPALEIKFSLTPVEKEQIIRTYYTLALDKLTAVDAHWKTFYIDDDCMIMPTIYTYLTVKRDTITQRIQIDKACEDYKWRRGGKAKRVKAFLQVVDRILNAKPELKKAPASDIMYL